MTVSDDNGTPGDLGDDFAPTYSSGDADNDGKLDPGETWLFASAGTAVAGQYGNIATAGGTPPAGDDPSAADPSHYFGEEPPPGGGCTYTQGFWKNHPDDWSLAELPLGGVVYTKAEALGLLKTPPKGDATIILAHQLIAAKLNVASGADDAAVSAAILLADAWLEIHPVGDDPQGPSRDAGIDLASLLDEYNNGLIGPGHCDDDPGDPGEEEAEEQTADEEDGAEKKSNQGRRGGHVELKGRGRDSKA
ncbi:hypothetical protein HQ560_12415 [bacterium]|nr:hypothetical protein [bacterium]